MMTDDVEDNTDLYNATLDEINGSILDEASKTVLYSELLAVRVKGMDRKETRKEIKSVGNRLWKFLNRDKVIENLRRQIRNNRR